MTFNIHHGRGTDKQIDLNRIAKVIEKSNADIIGLNEVDKHFSKRSHYKDQINVLAKKLNMHQAFGPSVSLTSKDSTTVRQYGNALLSRYPILTEKIHRFDFISGLIEGRSLLDTTIQMNKKVVQVNVTHLSLNPFLHRMQTKFIVNQLKKCSHPLIIMGDFNMKPGSKGWRNVTSECQDVWHMAGSGKGYTYPSLRPRIRLDFIFATSGLDMMEAEVVTNIPKASDHLPLKAYFRL